MELDPGWLVLSFFMLLEGFLVLLMIMPVPSNNVRRYITDFVTGLWDSKPVQYFSIAFLVLDAIYFYFVFDALLHPLYDLGILSPIDMSVTCEVKQAMVSFMAMSTWLAKFYEKRTNVCALRVFRSIAKNVTLSFLAWACFYSLY